jgi:hypothetical protein
MSGVAQINSDGSLDKLKTRMVVRCNLKDKNITEDKWSKTSSFRSLKMVLAHAARLKVRYDSWTLLVPFYRQRGTLGCL